MKRDAAAPLAEAKETLRAARVLLAEDLPRKAASEAYYAMFHAATATLASLDQAYSKHSAVVSAFGREFARTGVLPATLHQNLRAAFTMRQRATYDYEVEVSHVTAQDLITQAEQFIEAIEEYLEGDGA